MNHARFKVGCEEARILLPAQGSGIDDSQPGQRTYHALVGMPIQHQAIRAGQTKTLNHAFHGGVASTGVDAAHIVLHQAMTEQQLSPRRPEVAQRRQGAKKKADLRVSVFFAAEYFAVGVHVIDIPAVVVAAYCGNVRRL